MNDMTPAARDEIAATFGRQREAWNRAGIPDRQARLASLARVERILTEHRAAMAAAISADFGNRAIPETMLLEVLPSLNAIRHARRHLRSWMRPERRHVALTFQPASAWVQYQPLGVIGIVVPWNYPVMLALSPLVDALAAGNRAMIKPSELTPRFSALLQTLIGEAFPPDEVAVVTGGPDVAEAFCRLPFDHLLFTGSTNVGRKVMVAAAENLTPVTLELGGKSPVVVGADYPVARAARDIAFGKFINAGQTCIAPDYVLAPRAQVDALAEAIITEARRMFPTAGSNVDYTAMVTERHRRRLADAIAAAQAAGARVLSHDAEAATAAGKIGPTVVIDAPRDNLLMREEIFGPVLPIIPYDTLDQAIAEINGRDRPLALYCLSRDAATTETVMSRTISGGVTLNGTLLHVAQDDQPFGGVGASGIGSYHGRDGFRRLSHARAVHKVGFINPLDLLAPPYGKLYQLATKFLIARR
ncbi:MAG: coniferyl aldehyde dehydrogenase [Ferrovibrionaceae bacterium]